MTSQRERSMYICELGMNCAPTKPCMTTYRLGKWPSPPCLPFSAPSHLQPPVGRLSNATRGPAPLPLRVALFGLSSGRVQRLGLGIEGLALRRLAIDGDHAGDLQGLSRSLDRLDPAADVAVVLEPFRVCLLRRDLAAPVAHEHLRCEAAGRLLLAPAEHDRLGKGALGYLGHPFGLHGLRSFHRSALHRRALLHRSLHGKGHGSTVSRGGRGAQIEEWLAHWASVGL